MSKRCPEGKVSIGRYAQGPCYIEISDNINRRLIDVTMNESEFPKALTGLGDRSAKLTLYEAITEKKMSFSNRIQQAYRIDPMYSLALKLVGTDHYTEESLIAELDKDKESGTILSDVTRLKICNYVRDIKKLNSRYGSAQYTGGSNVFWL